MYQRGVDLPAGMERPMGFQRKHSCIILAARAYSLRAVPSVLRAPASVSSCPSAMALCTCYDATTRHSLHTTFTFACTLPHPAWLPHAVEVLVSFARIAPPHAKPVHSLRVFRAPLLPSSPLSLSPLHSPCHQKGLAGVSMLLVNQKVEYMEALTGFETANQYTVLNEHGHPTFHAAEVSNWMSRNFLGKNRPFTLNVVNPDGSPFLVIDRVRPPRPAYTVTFGALLQCTFAFPRTSVTYMYVILFRVPLNRSSPLLKPLLPLLPLPPLPPLSPLSPSMSSRGDGSTTSSA